MKGCVGRVCWEGYISECAGSGVCGCGWCVNWWRGVLGGVG